MRDFTELKSFPLLACLQDNELQKTSQSMIWKTVHRGEQILQEGDAGNEGIFFLSSGQLMAVYFTPEGREIIFSIIPDGGYFGEIAVLDGQERSLSIYASKDSKIAILPRQSFLHLIDTHQQFRSIVMRNMATRIRELTRNVHELTTFSVKERVGVYIVRVAQERKQFIKNGVLDDFPTHLEIANQIGSNREAVSRTISAYNQSGAIRAGRKSVVILEPDALLPIDFT